MNTCRRNEGKKNPCPPHTTVTVVVVTGIHWRMWKLVDESLRRSMTRASSKVALPRSLLSMKRKIVTVPWRKQQVALRVVGKLTGSKARWYHLRPTRGTGRAPHACGIRARGAHPQSPRKTSGKPMLRDSLQNIGRVLFRSVKAMTDEERLRNGHTLKKTTEIWWPKSV